MLIYINFRFNFLTKYHKFILNCRRIQMYSSRLFTNHLQHSRTCCIGFTNSSRRRGFSAGNCPAADNIRHAVSCLHEFDSPSLCSASQKLKDKQSSFVKDTTSKVFEVTIMIKRAALLQFET